MYNMKKIFYCFLSLLVLLITSCTNQTTVINKVIDQKVDIEENITIKDLEDQLCNVIEIAEQAVVGIVATFDNALLKTESYGSGVVIKKDSNDYYIITNRHVVVKQDNACTNIKLYLGSINLYLPCEIIAYDKKVDIALLKVTTEVLLSVARLGDSSLLKKGRFAVAIGSPYSLESYFNTVTVGHVSSPSRLINEDNYFYKELTNEYIQIDTTINVGCSGGGLFNLEGELIGINTWKLYDSKENIDNMNFAVPINLVKDLFVHYLG